MADYADRRHGFEFLFVDRIGLNMRDWIFVDDDRERGELILNGGRLNFCLWTELD
jgi:hypothetical protein